MRRLNTLLSTPPLLAILLVANQLSSAHAAISYSGNVDPSDPTTWTTSTRASVGKNGEGSVEVDDQSKLYSYYGYVGRNSGSTGTVTVKDAGSTWTNDGDLFVGNGGNGTLSITGGGAVSSSRHGYLGNGSGSTGTATVDGANSTWTNGGNLCVGYSGSGTLNITGGASVSNVDGTIGSQSGSTGVVTVDGAGSTWTNSSKLWVGKSGSGTLNVTGGGAVSNSYSQIGSNSGSTGVVTVDGSGSTLTSSGNLFVGSSGSGTLNITDGGAVSNSSSTSYIGSASGSTGVVTVDGVGSTWTNASLYVGDEGSGTLNITGGGAVSNQNNTRLCDGSSSTAVVTVDGAGSTWINSDYLTLGKFGSGTVSISGGGAVSATNVTIGDNSLLAVDVGAGSSLDASGRVTNNGTVRILADAGAAAESVYSPIAAASWSGSGVYQGVGGTWDAATHEFTVSQLEYGASGVAKTIDTSSVQRVLISDGATGWSLGASFLAADGTTALEFTATAISGKAFKNLQSLLPDGDGVLGAWNCTLAGTGYIAGDPVHLSFDVGADYSQAELDFWYYDGSDWTEYAPLDLTCDGQYANFTVTGFSGYAVTGFLQTVPEPGASALLIAAALSLVACRRRRRRSPIRFS